MDSQLMIDSLIFFIESGDTAALVGLYKSSNFAREYLSTRLDSFTNLYHCGHIHSFKEAILCFQ